MKVVIVKRSGWNKDACIMGPFWYLRKKMTFKGFLLLFFCVCTMGLGLIPVCFYCGYNGNKDYYHHLKHKNIYILKYQKHRKVM